MFARRLEQGLWTQKGRAYLVTVRGTKLYITDEAGGKMHIAPEPTLWALEEVGALDYEYLPEKYKTCVNYQQPPYEKEPSVYVANAKTLRTFITKPQQETDMKIEKVILVDGQRADEKSFENYLGLIRNEQAKLETLAELPASKAVANRRRTIQSNIKNLTTLMDHYTSEEG